MTKLLVAAVALAGLYPTAWAERCIVAEVPPGVAQFPATCERGYRTVPHSLLINFGASDGLECQWLDKNFQVTSTTPVPGGKIDAFKCILEVEIIGLGLYSGYHRIVDLPASGRMFSADQTPGDFYTRFSVDLLELQAVLPPGDPDFDLLRITAGTSLGLPSPGHTTATKLPPGQWAMDSFFDITYRVDWVGAPGGPFAGTSGSTSSATRMTQGEPPRRTHGVPDVGGTAQFPPSTALTLTGYQTPTVAPVLVNGLPMTGHAHGHLDLRNFNVTLDAPGGDYAGDVQQFTAEVVLDLFGTGTYAGFARRIVIPVTGKTQIGPRAPGLAVQAFPCELLELQGQIVGDPDFDLLRITAGTAFGLPSPGHTTLNILVGGNFKVDSFFDITYRIDFVGMPGGTFAGYSGSTQHQTPIVLGSRELDPCSVPDVGGTARFPAHCSGGYRSPAASLLALNGLPPDSPIVGVVVGHFLESESPGGPLDGHVQSLLGDLSIQMFGLGALAGFTRSLTVPVSGQSASGPRGGGASPQSFPADLTMLQGQITGDPDFDLLRITAGTAFGMPSPGHTVFSRTATGDWNVDSFFDITYRIDFAGAPGGALSGMSGSTESVNRFHAGVLQNVDVPTPAAAGDLEVGSAIPNPTSAGSRVELRLPASSQVDAAVFDPAGRRVQQLLRDELPAGAHVLRWDGREQSGRSIRSGLYFYRIRLGDRVVSRRVIVSH